MCLKNSDLKYTPRPCKINPKLVSKLFRQMRQLRSEEQLNKFSFANFRYWILIALYALYLLNQHMGTKKSDR